MTVLNSKDSTSRLENIRFLEETDPAYYVNLNRPHEDIEQRTKDLDRVFTPARGIRVRQTITASASVEIEVGIYVGTDGVNVSRSNAGAVQTIAIPAASAGQRRADLIYFNLAAGVAVRIAGTEVHTSTAFSPSLWPSLPSGLQGSIPLGILYVSDVPAVFNETISTDIAGRIIDVRPAPGANKTIFSSAIPLTDVTSGSVGTSPLTSRADHRHSLNVDATVPETLDGVKTASPGDSATYARRNHVHALSMEAVIGNILTDISGGSLGSGGKLSHSNHRHPLNVDATNPADISQTAASPGDSATYARRNHVHKLPDHLAKALGFFGASFISNTVSLLGVGVGSTVSSLIQLSTPIVVPANTYPNGVIVFAQAEAFLDITDTADVDWVIELSLSQVAGGGLAKQLSTTNTVGRNPPVVGVLGTLGSPASFGTVRHGDIPGTDGAWGRSHVLFGIWARTGTTNLTNVGGSDFDPTKETSIDFTRVYYSGGTNDTLNIGSRGIYVLGF